VVAVSGAGVRGPWVGSDLSGGLVAGGGESAHRSDELAFARCVQASVAAYDESAYAGAGLPSGHGISRQSHDSGMPTDHLAFGAHPGGEDPGVVAMSAGLGGRWERPDLLAQVHAGFHELP
jgi:hypothetical protein